MASAWVTDHPLATTVITAIILTPAPRTAITGPPGSRTESSSVPAPGTVGDGAGGVAGVVGATDAAGATAEDGVMVAAGVMAEALATDVVSTADAALLDEALTVVGSTVAADSMAVGVASTVVAVVSTAVVEVMVAEADTGNNRPTEKAENGWHACRPFSFLLESFPRRFLSTAIFLVATFLAAANHSVPVPGLFDHGSKAGQQNQQNLQRSI